ncbi:nitrate- and nitrite sensing domain-containing protein [Amycolatopsis sp. 195334CR]|uniref:nitrate- and nitrite sensing domain-containing protein n=1 Tax=Amycolatopsis sp. 195334CR TaxID=2814588 RepID=UPI001A8EB996|nr:nitrate- and nitrite sensing domain-containing protein [Amycolatopsis sp. 195334CR]MBN6041477.1 nitrate- and nitrite sensing domain-containing protein [Amycolatopsis sp. 195334CR]
MPVGKLLGRPPRRPSRWRSLARWRDWNLPVKLAAVTLVPILIAIVLGVLTIGGQVERSSSYQRMDRLVSLGGEVRTTLEHLQAERVRTAELLVQTTVRDSPELAEIRLRTDGALPGLDSAIERATALDTGVVGAAKEADAQVSRLTQIREQVDGGQLEPVEAITEYTAVTTGLLKLDTALTAGVSDDAIGGTPTALHDLLVAKEEVSLAQALVGYGIARRTLSPAELNQLRTTEVRLTDRLADFRAAASQEQRQDFDTTVAGPSFETRATLVRSALGEQGRSPEEALRETSAQQWTDSSTAVGSRLSEVSGRIGGQLSSVSANLADQASTGAGVLTVLLFAALVLAAAVVFLITRQLLRSLRVLRASALDIAEKQLPAAVVNIQEGRPQSTDVSPVPVTVKDEVGEVARAFDAVHSQALRLAVEQAAMRTGYSSVFVNLSRRSQSLVQRQLQLIERLERDEEDADQLATLFQLDHLATRMRRNNENLMVLSGAEPARRSGQPVSTTDMLRAAVSEIEQYQRVVVQPPPPARVVGYAASDLMRLIAELLDNATAFSAPETQVTVATRLSEDRVLSVDILDKGIGMNEAEVAEANTRLTEAGSVDLATSRRMGLFVVGRLAGRHGIGVVLHGGRDIVGVRATVTVPAELVMDAIPGTGTRPRLEPPAQSVPSPSQPAGALPRRKPNGANRSGVLPASSPVPAPAKGSALERRLSGEEAPSPAEISGTALFSPITPTEEIPVTVVPEEPEAAPLTSKPKPAESDSEATLPSGKALFVSTQDTESTRGVLSDWWAASVTPEPRPEPEPELPENTPIFDAMLSAWFRKSEPADEPAPVTNGKAAVDPEPAEAEPEWDFPSDESWRTVEAVSKSEPSSFTAAGLPRRQRGEKLLPGSAAASTPVPVVKGTDLPVRDPANVRGRLSSFQQGVNRGRQETGRAVPEEPSAEVPAIAQVPLGPAPAPEPTRLDTTRGVAPKPPGKPGPTDTPAMPTDATAKPGGGTAKPTDAAAKPATGQPAGATAKATEAPTKPGGAAKGTEAATKPGGATAIGATAKATGEATPKTGARSGSKAAPKAGTRKTAAKAEPSTKATPPAKAEPGAAQAEPGTTAQAEPGTKATSPAKAEPGAKAAAKTSTRTATKATPRDTPEEAKNGAETQAATETQAPETQATTQAAKNQATTQAAKNQAAAKAGAETAQSGATAAQAARGRAEGTAETRPVAKGFGTDEGWQAAQAVAEATPSSFTAAGLPRRRRGEHLVPGSAAPATPAAAPRPGRDPHDVRGRLSSFQQGVRRGRHHNAQAAADGKTEKVEGE